MRARVADQMRDAVGNVCGHEDILYGLKLRFGVTILVEIVHVLNDKMSGSPASNRAFLRAQYAPHFRVSLSKYIAEGRLPSRRSFLKKLS